MDYWNQESIKYFIQVIIDEYFNTLNVLFYTVIVILFTFINKEKKLYILTKNFTTDTKYGMEYDRHKCHTYAVSEKQNLLVCLVCITL